MSTLRPLHLAFPVKDLAETRRFYTQVLGCECGREAPLWIDFNLYGHQVVAHLNTDASKSPVMQNPVDGDNVPVPHFGVVLTTSEWIRLRDKLKSLKEIRWIIEPRIRFQGLTGEQATMFLLDPSGNALEFKAFDDVAQLFAKN